MNAPANKFSDLAGSESTVVEIVNMLVPSPALPFSLTLFPSWDILVLSLA
jgi:hypothetical protein